jgi:uncharacterized protein (UPF0276 family)
VSNSSTHSPVQSAVVGAGLGLRRGLLSALAQIKPGSGCSTPDFMEITPDNWIGIGGAYGRQLRAFTERYAFLAHGLSLSLGGTDPLDHAYIAQIKTFLQLHGIQGYSEHLSYCSAGGHLYDLMPIPFTDEAVRHTAARIRQVQDMLDQRIAIENISYYAAPFQQMKEIDFIKAVLDEADCDLLLDVNNIYVNSINHGYDAAEFLAALPGERVAYIHVAGHFQEEEDLLVDTHGAAVCDPVWALLKFAYQQLGVRPTVLERDFNYPPVDVLLAEVQRIRDIQAENVGV